MRKACLWALCAVMAALPCLADVSVYGEYWDTEDLGDDIGAGLRLRLGGEGSVALELKATYFADMTEDGHGGGVELEAIPVEIGLSVGLVDDEQINIYACGGAGYYFLDTDHVDVDDELGWYAGGGIEIYLSDNLSLFAEAGYRGIEATAENDDLDLIEDEVTVDLSGPAVRVGLIIQ